MNPLNTSQLSNLKCQAVADTYVGRWVNSMYCTVKILYSQCLFLDQDALHFPPSLQCSITISEHTTTIPPYHHTTIPPYPPYHYLILAIPYCIPKTASEDLRRRKLVRCSRQGRWDTLSTNHLTVQYDLFHISTSPYIWSYAPCTMHHTSYLLPLLYLPRRNWYSIEN